MKWGGHSVPDTRTHDELRRDWITVLGHMVDMATAHPIEYTDRMARLRGVNITAWIMISDAVREATRGAMR